MNKLSETFKEFSSKQMQLATDPRTLTFCFGAATVAYLVSSPATAAAVAIAPTVIAGGSMVGRGISKICETFAPRP
jgi:hypothetical protein